MLASGDSLEVQRRRKVNSHGIVTLYLVYKYTWWSVCDEMHASCINFIDKQDVQGDSPSIKGEGGSLSQLEIFQLILQKQCDAMVGLGVDPSIKV